MAEVLVSPGIQITETDRSFVPARPLVAGAAIIGPTVKGPANIPVVVTSYGDYQRTFGTTFMLNRYRDNAADVVSASVARLQEEAVPYIQTASYNEVASGSTLDNDETYYIRSGSEYVEYTKRDASGSYVPTTASLYTLGVSYTPLGQVSMSYGQDEEILVYNFDVEVSGNAMSQIVGEYYHKEIEDYIDTASCSPATSSTYEPLKNLTTPYDYQMVIDGFPESEEAWEPARIQQKSQEFLTSIAAKSYFEQGGESLLVERVVDNEFRAGRAVISTENGEKTAFVIRTLSEGEYLNNWDKNKDFQNRSEDSSPIKGVIRDDGSLIKGTKDNIRWEIADVDPETGTFSIYVRRGDDVDYDKSILEVFSGLTLDPDSTNYIARRIGDQYQELAEEPDPNDINKKIYYVNTFGNYPNVSKYIRVEKVNDIYGYFLADGYTRRGSEEDKNASVETKKEGDSCITIYPDDVANLLPKTCEGGFYDAAGKLFTTHEDEMNAIFFEDIQNVESGVGDSVKVQGILPEKYDPLIAVLENQDEYEIDIVSVPGLTATSNMPQTDAVVSLAQKRGDCIAVIDLVGFGSMIAAVQTAATSTNSNYAAAYWPWLQMYSSTGRLEWVPASVVIPGVYVYNDRVAAPWFAPAGMIRGSVQGVVQPERKLLKQHRDALYKKNVNPISILPGNGITIYGQKTLQKKASALDRVNVRRLLIELKRTVKNMASGILFEQNDAQLRSAFKANLDQYLESVVKRRGLYGYHTEVESQNTPDVIDRNEFRAKIWIQPTKVIEFIYIDFTVTNTGVEFNS